MKTHEVVHIVLLRRDVLPQSLFKKYQENFELLNKVLDASEPAANRIASTRSLEVIIDVTGIQGSLSTEQLNPQQGTVLYRVAQESLTHVYKHALATRVDIRLRQPAQAVRMEIVDNGRAFSVSNPTKRSDRQPLGLPGMQDRVLLVKRTVRDRVGPETGNHGACRIPLANLPPLKTAPTDVPATPVSS